MNREDVLNNYYNGIDEDARLIKDKKIVLSLSSLKIILINI